jgi:hypothetical protein
MATAQTRLFAVADKKEIVYGEALTVTVKTEDNGPPLNSINLDKLKRDFNVYGISGNTQTQIKKGRQVKSQTMTLTLYPLRTGRLQIPAFTLKGSSTRPLNVTVNAFGKHAPRVIIKAVLDTSRPQVRQEATLVLEIYDDSNLLWTAPREITASAVHQRKLAESQRQEMLDGLRYTVHRYVWAIMPLREGGFAVEFPLVDASTLGKRLRYAVPPLWLDAAPVPAYLPVHVPIGKPEILPEVLPEELALERPVNWTLTVQGAGVSVEGLGKMLSSVRSSEALRFYPAKISASKVLAATAGQTLTVTLPFVPMQTGRLQLPDINVPYYDPVSARLESIFIPGRVVEVFNPLWRSVFKIFIVLILLAGLTGLGYWLFRKYQRGVKRKKQLQAIVNAPAAQDLARALLGFEAETATPSCRTLQQWLRHMQLTYIVDDRLADTVLKITEAQYGSGAQERDISELARDISGMLKKLRNRKTDKGKVSFQNTVAWLYPGHRTIYRPGQIMFELDRPP